MDETKRRTAAHSNPSRYRSYLLRLWREAPGAPWRCQVHCVGTGCERRFGGLDGLFRYLEAETGGAGASDGAEGSPGENREKEGAYDP